MKRFFTLLLTFVVALSVFEAQVSSVAVVPSDSKTEHTIAVELVRKSPIFDSGGNLIKQSGSDYFPIGASHAIISRQEITSGEVVLHAGIYIYNDPGTASLTLALYPNDPAITLKSHQKVIVDGKTVSTDGDALFGNAYSVFGRINKSQYSGAYSAINDPAILTDGGISNQKDLWLNWIEGGGNTRIAYDPYREYTNSAPQPAGYTAPYDLYKHYPYVTLAGAKDLYFVTFDIILPKNLPEGDYFINFDKTFCSQAKWDSEAKKTVKGNPTYAPLKITVEGLPKKGDLDGSNFVNVTDIIRMLQFLSDSNKYALTAEQREQADCFYEAKSNEQYPSDTFPSYINAQDLSVLVQYVLKDISYLPVYGK